MPAFSFSIIAGSIQYLGKLAMMYYLLQVESSFATQTSAGYKQHHAGL
jgi:hypothetical protein